MDPRLSGGPPSQPIERIHREILRADPIGRDCRDRSVAAVGVVACDSSGDKTTPAANSTKAPDKVGYVTGFGSFGRESYA